MQLISLFIIKTNKVIKNYLKFINVDEKIINKTY